MSEPSRGPRRWLVAAYRWLFSELRNSIWEPISPRPLAAFRIAFSVVLLAEVLHVVARRDLFFLWHPLVEEVPKAVLIHLAIWVGSLVALMIGFATPVAAALNYWLVTKYFATTDFLYHVDWLYIPCSLLLIALPSYRAFSVDRWIIKRLFRVDLASYPIPRLFHTLTIYWVMGFMYFDSTLYKLQSPFWLDGLGFWLPASYPQFTAWTWNPILNLEYLVKAAGYITLVFELIFIFVFWISRARRFLLPIGVGLHLGIAIVLPLPLFGALMVVMYILFFPDAGMNRWLDWVWRQWRRLRPAKAAAEPAQPPSASLATPERPMLRADRWLCWALLPMMVFITLIQRDVTFNHQVFSPSTHARTTRYLGLTKHSVFGQRQFIVMQQAVAVVYYDEHDKEHWLSWVKRDGHIGLDGYSRYWTWWWLVSLPGNASLDDDCARIAEDWAKRNHISLERGRIVVKVRPLITGHFWEQDRHKKMEEIPWTDVSVIKWRNGERVLETLPAEVQAAIDNPPAESFLPLDEWREVGGTNPGAAYLVDGWSWVEGWGRWSRKPAQKVALPQAGELGQAITVKLDVIPYTRRGVRSQPYFVYAGDLLLASGELREEGVIEIDVPASATAKRSIVLDIITPKAAKAQDGRMLGLGLRRVMLIRTISKS